MAILKEYSDNGKYETLTGRKFREKFEMKVAIDLSHREDHLDQVLRKHKNEEENKATNTSKPVRAKSCPAKTKGKRQRKKRIDLSDDEFDEDYHPTKKPKKLSKKKKVKT